MSNFFKKAWKPLSGVPALLVLAALLTLTTGCDTDKGFVPVTGIIGVPTVAIKDRNLTLHGTIVPANATNRTIVWSCDDSNVAINGNILNASAAATVGTDYTITATITDGAAESVPYTEDFIITAFDTGSGVSSNPFGDATNPVWVVDKDGYGYPVYDTNLATITNNTWTVTENGHSYNNGTYTWLNGTYAAVWTVSGGQYSNYEGIAIIDSGTGVATISNFADDLSHMNGTMVKLVPTASVEGTWTTDYRAFNGLMYMQIKAENDGTFVTSVRANGSAPWTPLIRGSYTKSTNPAPCIIAKVNTNYAGGSESWVDWDDLPPMQQQALGGSQTLQIAVYGTGSTIGKGVGVIFTKQTQ
jgi:hypothetical protein